MKGLTLVGWVVMHSLWQCTLIAGLTAMALSVLRDRHARIRYRIGCASLALMTILPVATAIAGADVLDRRTRNQTVALIDRAVGLPAVVTARAYVIPAAAIVWMAGLSLYAWRIAIEWRRAQDLRRLNLERPAGPIALALSDLRARVHVPGPVQLFESARAGVPMVLGWRRPVILLPPRAIADLSPDQLRGVLAHELAHVRRRDYLANLFQIAADACLFHHPAARWVSRRVRIEREYCCDDVAVAIGGDAREYARALAALEEARADCRLAVAAASGTLLDRIQRVVGQPRPTLTPRRGLVALVSAVIVSAIILGLAAAVPPSLPLDTKLRMRRPAPAGVIPATPASDSLPRKRQADPTSPAR